MGKKRPDGFLTETHRAVLSGEWEGSDSTLRTHKSEIRRRAKASLQDLIEVANSDKIDNESKVEGERVFEPKELRELLTSIVVRGGPQSEEYQHVSEQYRNELYFEINRFLLGFQPDGADSIPPQTGEKEDTEEDENTEITCHNCGYEWLYTGNAEEKATCPSCSSKTPINR